MYLVPELHLLLTHTEEYHPVSYITPLMTLAVPPTTITSLTHINIVFLYRSISKDALPQPLVQQHHLQYFLW